MIQHLVAHAGMHVGGRNSTPGTQDGEVNVAGEAGIVNCPVSPQTLLCLPLNAVSRQSKHWWQFNDRIDGGGALEGTPF